MAKAYNPIGWENGTKEADAYVTIGGVDYDVTPEQWDGNTPVDATNLDHMEKGIQNSYDVKLLAVTDTEPSECVTGDVYYNTTNKLLYTATGTDTWSSTGTEPLEGILYIVFDEENNQGNSYSWNGTDLSSVGGGGGGGTDEVIIGDEEPTTDDWKIWIDSGEVNNLGSEINVSATMPTTNEPLWIKKGKNLVNPSNINIVKSTNVNSVESLSTGARVNLKTTNYGAYALFPIGKYKDFFGEKLTFSSTVKPNSTRNVGLMLWSSTTPDFVSITNLKEKTGSASSSGTNIADTYEFNDDTLVDYYVGIGLYANYGNNPVTSTDYTDYTNLQVEANATQTSYEAYVDKKLYTKNANNVYESFYDESKLNNKVYSTNEVKIGTWINGKPVYRKCFEVQTPSYATAPYDMVWIDVTDLDISVITDLKAIIFNNSAMFITPFAYDVSNSAHISLYYNRTSKKIQFATNTTTYNGLTSRVIVEYTKTTD